MPEYAFIIQFKECAINSEAFNCFGILAKQVKKLTVLNIAGLHKQNLPGFSV